jgi:DNA-binding transcriptional regulator LsrR (DeoR family)
MKIQNDDYFKYDFLARIAWAYYVDDMTQDSIAELYDIPRIKVQRMLKEASEVKMATISISNPYCNMLSCEKELVDRYGIFEAIVVPTAAPRIYNDLTIAAAMYLERKWMSNIKLLGIGGGRTLSCMPNAFDTITRKPNGNSPAVVSLTGILAPDAAMSSMNNAQQVAQAMGSTFYGIWSPGMAQTEEEYQVFINQKSIRDALTLANNADIKVVSIGTIEDNYNGPVLGEKRVDDIDFWELKGRNVVGEVLAHFFDKEGNIVDHSITKRSVVVDIPTKRGKVVAVSGGTHKIEAIRGALKGKLIDVLVTDYDTCMALLKD